MRAQASHTPASARQPASILPPAYYDARPMLDATMCLGRRRRLPTERAGGRRSTPRRACAILARRDAAAVTRRCGAYVDGQVYLRSRASSE